MKALHLPSSHILLSNGEDKEGEREREEEEEEGEGVEHSQANCLGADLEAGTGLYRDLQTMYSNISVWYFKLVIVEI